MNEINAMITTDYADLISNVEITKTITNDIKNNNNTCPSEIPSITSYVNAINAYGIILFVSSTIAVLVVFLVFADTVRHIMRKSPPRTKAHSAFVVGVYPAVALASYCSIIVPRANLLSEAATQGVFMVGLYQLFCLFVQYCGGEAELIRKTKSDKLCLKVGPCCCWPCCCLPQLNITKTSLTYLRMLVLQLPVVQGLIYSTLLVMWAERESLYEVNYMYFQPLVIISILLGVWGMVITTNLLKNVLTDYALPAKYIVLQMVLLFAKLQGLIMRILTQVDVFPCNPPITPTVYANIIYNTLMLCEILLLGIIARKLYKMELPDLNINCNNKQPIVTTHITTISSIVQQNNETNNNNNNMQQYNNNNDNNNNVNNKNYIDIQDDNNSYVERL